MMAFDIKNSNLWLGYTWIGTHLQIVVSSTVIDLIDSFQRNWITLVNLAEGTICYEYSRIVQVWEIVSAGADNIFCFSGMTIGFYSQFTTEVITCDFSNMNKLQQLASDQKRKKKLPILPPYN